MKSIIMISSTLLVAGAIYGFVDYRKQLRKGNLETLYKDSVYNAKPVVVINAEEKALDIEDFSRSAIVDEPISEQPVVLRSAKKKSVFAAKEKTEEETSFNEMQKEEPVAVIEEDTIQVAKDETVIEKTDSVQVKKTEERVKLSSFSRAPIGKRVVKERRVKVAADSISAQ